MSADQQKQELGLDTESLELNPESIDSTDEVTGVEERIGLMKERERKDLAVAEANAKNEVSIAKIQDLIARLATAETKLAVADKERKTNEESIAEERKKNESLTTNLATAQSMVICLGTCLGLLLLLLYYLLH